MQVRIDRRIHAGRDQKAMLDEIAELIRAQLDRVPVRRCDYLFLVGGFANCKPLQHLIQAEFRGNTGFRLRRSIHPKICPGFTMSPRGPESTYIRCPAG